MNSLPGYSFKEMIHKGKISSIYKGIQDATKQLVVIKFLNKENLNQSQITRLLYEYTLTKKLNEVLKDQIITPLELIQDGGTMPSFMKTLEPFH